MKVCYITSYNHTIHALMHKSLPIFRILGLLLLCGGIASGLQAQKHQFGLRYTMPNYILPLDNVPAPLEGFENWGGGLEFEYQRRIAPNLLIGLPLRFTSGPAISDVNNASAAAIRPEFDVEEIDIFGIGAQLVFEPFAPSTFFDPQLFAGIGLTYDFDGNTVPEIPLGVNLHFNLGDFAYVSPQLSYRLALGDLADVRTNIQAGIGVHVQLDGEGKEKEVVPPPVIDTDGDGIEDSADQCPTEPGPSTTLGCPDTDGDGIADKNDKCPEVVGTSAFMGCPDTDGDGIADPDDQCPEQAGPASNNGCPVADADGDGIPDAEDKCPNEAGLASMMGCPDSDGDGISDREDDCPRQPGTAANNGCPDTDSDGVVDKDDKCPRQAGPASNQGCPEITEKDQETIDFAIQNINFETGSAVLTADSRGVLDRVEDILRRYPGYQLAIGGHTDSVGSAESNMRLSQRRAQSVYEYLVAKGIRANRMSYEGFGETLPIADNRYKDGREQNRRVTLDLMIE